MIHYILKTNTKKGTKIVKYNPIYEIENILFAGTKEDCKNFKLTTNEKTI